MSEQVERLITGVMTIALGIVGVAFIFALVTKGSNTANVAGALSVRVEGCDGRRQYVRAVYRGIGYKRRAVQHGHG